MLTTYYTKVVYASLNNLTIIKVRFFYYGYSNFNPFGLAIVISVILFCFNSLFHTRQNDIKFISVG